MRGTGSLPHGRARHLTTSPQGHQNPESGCGPRGSMSPPRWLLKTLGGAAKTRHVPTPPLQFSTVVSFLAVCSVAAHHRTPHTRHTGSTCVGLIHTELSR